MYKVFKDNCFLILASSTDIPHVEGAITLCIKNVDDIGNIIDLHCNGSAQTIIVLFKSMEELIKKFESLYNIRTAAGGWVYNLDGDLLMINRQNHWDIPKGHIEEGESLEQCAIREVEEETGVGGLQIVSYLGVSRHIFRYSENEDEILKESHWFKMKTNYSGNLLPQLEEDITEVKWHSESNIENIRPTMWSSLSDFYIQNIIEKKH